MGLLQKANRAYTYQVSILIPMYNEESSILFVLNKVKTSLKALHFEIIVVDDGSQDRSGEKVKQFIQMYPDTPVQYHYQKNQGKGGAIRTAIQNSQGKSWLCKMPTWNTNPVKLLNSLNPFMREPKWFMAQEILTWKTESTQPCSSTGVVFSSPLSPIFFTAQNSLMKPPATSSSMLACSKSSISSRMILLGNPRSQLKF
jgi:GT2 family glycosyltransferase